MKKFFVMFLSTISLISCSSNVTSEPLGNISQEKMINVLSSDKINLSTSKTGFYSTGILKIKNVSDTNKVILALKELKKSTSKESGNLDFIILQDKADPTRIIIWEHFKTEDEFKKHLESEHLKKFLSLNLVEFVVGYPAKIIA